MEADQTGFVCVSLFLSTCLEALRKSFHVLRHPWKRESDIGKILLLRVATFHVVHLVHGGLPLSPCGKVTKVLVILVILL